MRCSTLQYNCLSEPCSFPSLLARRQWHVAKLRQLHLLSCKTLFSFTSMLLPKACRIRTSSLPRSACATAYNLPALSCLRKAARACASCSSGSRFPKRRSSRGSGGHRYVQRPRHLENLRRLGIDDAEDELPTNRARWPPSHSIFWQHLLKATPGAAHQIFSTCHAEAKMTAGEANVRSELVAVAAARRRWTLFLKPAC